MIPKVIHYCWFGKNPKSEEISRCIESWRKTCPDFKIVEWNESNFPIGEFPFTKRMYKEKKWAFVSDYVRLHTLVNEGGFYLDTDMLVLQSLSLFAKYDCVLGEESPGIISAGMIGASPNHPFIESCKAFYDKDPQTLMTIPRVLSEAYKNYPNKDSLKVFPPKAFYPFDSDHIKNYHGQDLGPDVIGVHLWHYSWGHPLNKILKRAGLHGPLKRLSETLRIKKFLKKLLGFV